MTDIKVWSKTILKVYKVLPQIVQSLDECNMATALSAFRMDTMRAVESIQKNNNRKLNLINLKVVVDKAMSAVRPKHRQILYYRFIKRQNFQQISDMLDVCLRTIFRRYACALEELENVLIDLGYNEKWLEKNFYSDVFVGNMYEKVEEEEKQKQLCEKTQTIDNSLTNVLPKFQMKFFSFADANIHAVGNVAKC